MTDHEDRDGQPTVVTPFSTPRTFAPKPPVFAPDALLAGRFRIIRFIARGGMGEVYEAQDQVLGERVALKTIRSDVASDQRSMERFLREVHLSRSVTNPNGMPEANRATVAPMRPSGAVSSVSASREKLCN